MNCSSSGAQAAAADPGSVHGRHAKEEDGPIGGQLRAQAHDHDTAGEHCRQPSERDFGEPHRGAHRPAGQRARRQHPVSVSAEDLAVLLREGRFTTMKCTVIAST